MKQKKYKLGFTLLEVMTALAILAIISMFALGYYRQYVTKARLQEVKSALSGNILYLEGMYNKNNGYKNSAGGFITRGDLPYKTTGSVKIDGSGGAGYTIKIKADCNESSQYHSTANTFCLIATPENGQETAPGGGKECGIIKVDQSGGSEHTGTDPNFKCFEN